MELRIEENKTIETNSNRREIEDIGNIEKGLYDSH